MANDVMCDSTGIVSSPPDEDCTYDNVVHYAYNHDARSDLSDTQNIITHTIAIKVGGSSVAESLYGNSVDQISNEGVYTVANSGDEVLGKIMTIMGYIRAGFYSRSSPVVSADGEYVIYSFYEISGDNPLAEGHVRAYRVGSRPRGSVHLRSDHRQRQHPVRRRGLGRGRSARVSPGHHLRVQPRRPRRSRSARHLHLR
jgi:hypothetical protein